MIGRLVLLLLAANLGWLAWTQGWLRPLGLVPQEQAEPQRLQRQVQPQALRLQPLEPASAAAAADDTPARRSTAASATPASAAEPAAASASAPAPTACLQIGTFDASQIDVEHGGDGVQGAVCWRLCCSGDLGKDRVSQFGRRVGLAHVLEVVLAHRADVPCFPHAGAVVRAAQMFGNQVDQLFAQGGIGVCGHAASSSPRRASYFWPSSVRWPSSATALMSAAVICRMIVI